MRYAGIRSQHPEGSEAELLPLARERINKGRRCNEWKIFRRRITLFVPPIKETLWIPAPEDLVIQKLRWARNKDLDDARNILAVQGESIDYAHLELWCERHGTLERLAEVRAGISPGL